MKKLLFISMAALTLGACANEGTDSPSSTSSQPEPAVSQESAVSSAESQTAESSSEASENSESATSEDLASVSDEEAEKAEAVSEYAEYEELAAQEVFVPSDYEGRLITDNPGTRVFLFRKDGRQMYKTIYIKHDNRLKVIDLQADQMVFNERI